MAHLAQLSALTKLIPLVAPVALGYKKFYMDHISCVHKMWRITSGKKIFISKKAY